MARPFMIGVITAAILLLASGRSARAQGSPEPEGVGPAGPPESVERVPPPDLSSTRKINGIDVRAANRFWEKWSLVNVRYRTDTSEQRFVYANALAMKTLAAGRTDYPDGAMFGKIGFYTSLDPAFPVSREAAKFQRIQLMKKDSRKFAATGGWSYAVLPLQAAARSEGDDRDVAVSCHACHVLAQNRGFVFTSTAFSGHPVHPLLDFGSRFVERRIEELNPSDRAVVRRLTSEGTGTVRYFATKMFSAGVNYENVPALLELVTKNKATYLISDPESHLFLAAKPDARCPDGRKVIFSYLSEAKDGRSAIKARTGLSCGKTLTWGE